MIWFTKVSIPLYFKLIFAANWKNSTFETKTSDCLLIFSGGCSSDTRSHSSHSPPEQLKLQNSKADDTKGQSEHSTSPHRKTAQVYDEMTNCPTNSGKPKTSSKDAQCSPPTNCTTNFVQQTALSNAVDCSPAKPKEEVATELHGASSQNPVSTTENLSPTGSKESKKDVGKPPKPQIQSQNTPSLPHMPCVSTTGNGPNGKTINGFLYRYTKTEVSIVCVCHGTSFSPAEFVLHAGGTDVSQPLKHITVIPSAIWWWCRKSGAMKFPSHVNLSSHHFSARLMRYGDGLICTFF